MIVTTFHLLAALLVAAPAAARASEEGMLLDIARWARRCCVEDEQRAPTWFEPDAPALDAPAQRRSDGRYVYGLAWSEERDISEIVVSGVPAADMEGASVEYWSSAWPYPPPRVPNIEDPREDPWQGRWVVAGTRVLCGSAAAEGERAQAVRGAKGGAVGEGRPGGDEGACRFRFGPLAREENPRAGNLPGVQYRRTLKLRLLLPNRKAVESTRFARARLFPNRKAVGSARFARARLFPGPARPRVAVHTGSRLRELEVLVVPFGKEASSPAAGRSPRVEVWNGELVSAHPRRAGLGLKLRVAEGGLPGANDVTVVSVARERGPAGSPVPAFSFAPADLERGPICVPAFGLCAATPAQAAAPLPAPVVEKRVRDRIPLEPEQGYERAASEIPPLDPVERQGGPLYLPLAVEASWQKFAFEWGGHVFISKSGTKAMAEELASLEWSGDRISWRIGTGARAEFRAGAGESIMSTLEDHLPVARVVWTQEGVAYAEEAFATALEGPLAFDDPARGERAPTALLVRLEARNAAGRPATAHVWLALEPGEEVALADGLLLAGAGALVRGHVRLPPGARARVERVTIDKKTGGGAQSREGPAPPQAVPALHAEVPLGPGESRALELALPFAPRLSPEQRRRLAALDHAAERARVVERWRALTSRAVPFDLPDERLMAFARGTVARILISATRDPASGLFMAPAASYRYLVYANEAVFQARTLDGLGQAALADRLLEPLWRLQGSRKLPGRFGDDQKALYHGVRVAEGRDYTAAAYGLNPGTVLLGLAEHYLLTRDRAWLAKTTAGMKAAAAWIDRERARTRSARGANAALPWEAGLLPATQLEDNSDWAHWFAVNAYAAAGMRALAEALADVRDPEAARLAAAARAYTADLRRAVLDAAARAPVVRRRDGLFVPYVPVEPYQRLRGFGPLKAAYYSRYGKEVPTTYRLAATREVLYGPLTLLSTGIFAANEPLADFVLDDWEDNLTLSTSLGIPVHGFVEDERWFSQGGMVFQPNLQSPFLAYLRRGEIEAALRSFWNGFVACHYPSVNVLTEEFRVWRHPSGPFYKIPDESRVVQRIRDLLVFESGETLWLAAGVPRAWLAPGKRFAVTQAPTLFGPTSYEVTAAGNEIRARIDLPRRNPPREAWLVLRIPGAAPLRAVTIDSKPWPRFEAASGRIRLPNGPAPFSLIARF